MPTAQQIQITTDTVDGITVYFANGILAASVGGPAPVGRTMLRRYQADGTAEVSLIAAGLRYAHMYAREFCEDRAR